MRSSVHERPQDFDDSTIPFSCSKHLQSHPGFEDLREKTRHVFANLIDIKRLRELEKILADGPTSAQSANFIESTMNSCGFLSKRQILCETKWQKNVEEYDAAVSNWKQASTEVADAIIGFIREAFIPSPALVDLEESLEYFANKPLSLSSSQLSSSLVAAKFGVSTNRPRGNNSTDNHMISADSRSIFLSGLVGNIARHNLPNGELTLTSRDGMIRINMGTVSPILFSLKETAREYSIDAYCHRRACLSQAFLSVLTMEEEKVARHYKLLIAEVQNALNLPLPNNWINSCFNATSADVWNSN
jgi:hypothetical protein